MRVSRLDEGLQVSGGGHQLGDKSRGIKNKRKQNKTKTGNCLSSPIHRDCISSDRWSQIMHHSEHAVLVFTARCQAMLGLCLCLWVGFDWTRNLCVVVQSVVWSCGRSPRRCKAFIHNSRHSPSGSAVKGWAFKIKAGRIIKAHFLGRRSGVFHSCSQ